MESKQTLLKSNEEQSILQDIEYYKYIFKKTEKIACAVLYILRSDLTIVHIDVIKTDLETSARTLLDVSLQSLRASVTTVEKYAKEVRHVLVELESWLRMAHSARLLSGDLLQVFIHEIDSIQRTLKKYVEPVVENPLGDDTVLGSTRERRAPRIKPVQGLGVEGVSPLPTVSRRDRVLNILRDKGQATIKDIVDVVTDCSEKTIQRDLISLIKDNIIIREGERRWSKYRLI